QGDALLEEITAFGGFFCEKPFQLILGKRLSLPLMGLKQILAFAHSFDFEDIMPEGSTNGFDKDRGMPLKHFQNRIPIASLTGIGKVGPETGVLLEQMVNPPFVAVDRRIKQSFAQVPGKGGQFRGG